MKTVIYGLFCPMAGAIRYIGKSSEVQKRFKAHLYAASSSGRTHRQRWMAKVLAAGLKPSLVILEEVDSGDWKEAERRWIAQALEQGWPLTNITSGGDGASPLNEAARALKKAQMSKPETRARMSAAAKARWADPQKRAKATASIQSPEAREKYRQVAIARSTDEYRAAASARMKAVWSDPEKRAKIVAGITDETRASVSAAASRMWADSDKREKMLSNLAHDPKTTSDLWKTPEYRGKQTATRSTQKYKLKASQGQMRRYQNEGGTQDELVRI